MTSKSSLSLARMKPEEWQALLQRERKLRSAAFAAARDGHAKPIRREALTKWWSCVALVLDGSVQRAHGDSFDRPVPMDLFKIISSFAAAMGQGNLPGPIRDVPEKGRVGIGSREQRHIDIAAAYIQAAKRGEVNDPKPIKTVATAYSVTRQCAQRWARRNVAEYEFSSRSLPERMAVAAEGYREGGRSSAAILARKGKSQID